MLDTTLRIRILFNEFKMRFPGFFLIVLAAVNVAFSQNSDIPTPDELFGRPPFEITYSELKEIPEDSINYYQKTYDSLKIVANENLYANNLALSIDDLNKSLAILRGFARDSSSECANLLNSLGYAYSMLNKFDTATVCFYQALREAEKTDGANEISGMCYKGLGRIFKARGDFIKARRAHQTAIQIFDRSGLSLSVGDIESKIISANILYKFGEYAKAEKEYLELLTAMREVAPGSYHINVVYGCLGGLYFTIGDYVKAEEFFLESVAEDTNRFSQKSFSYQGAQSALGRIYRLQGRYDLAEKSLLEAIDSYRAYPTRNLHKKAFPLTQLGIMYHYSGEPEKAEDYFNQALDVAREAIGDSSRYYANVLLPYSKYLIDQNRLDEAEQALDKVVDIYKNYYDINETTLTRNERDAFWKEVDKALKIYFELSFFNSADDSLTVKTVDNSLFVKSKMLRENVSLRKYVRLYASGEERRKFDEYLKLRRRLLKYENLIDLGDLRLVEIREKVKDSVDAIESGLFAAANMRLGEESSNANFDRIRASLAPNEAAVEIVRLKVRAPIAAEDSVVYLAFIIKPGAAPPETVVFRNGGEMESYRFEYYQKAIEHKLVDVMSREVYWQPIAERLAGFDRIYVSKDGIYHKISLKSLFNPKTGNFLISEKDLVFTTSLSSILNKSDFEPLSIAKNKTCSIYADPKFYSGERHGLPIAEARSYAALAASEESRAFGEGGISPLPHSRIEALEIANILNDAGFEANLFLGEDATEANLKNEDSPGIIHIATHGEFLPVDPRSSYENRGDSLLLDPKKFEDAFDRSMLYFAGSGDVVEGRSNWSFEKEDDILTASEALTLDLVGTEIAVLSACKTGAGDVRNGEGVYGMQRAFVEAGSRSVAMSLWEASDAAAKDMFSRFYYYLASGEYDINEAFTKAQKELMTKYVFPYYWAPFELSF